MLYFFAVFFLIYLVAPLPLKAVLLIINYFLPDTIVMVDELLMTILFFDRMRKSIALASFVEHHKILSLVIGVVVIATAGYLIYSIIVN